MAMGTKEKIKVMKDAAESNICKIADFENKALLMRFINDNNNNNMEDIELWLISKELKNILQT